MFVSCQQTKKIRVGRDSVGDDALLLNQGWSATGNKHFLCLVVIRTALATKQPLGMFLENNCMETKIEVSCISVRKESTWRSSDIMQ